MNMEKMERGESVHEGERYLRLLGFDQDELEKFRDKRITSSSGEEFAAIDYLEVCGEHARPLLAGLETLNPEDPRYEPTRVALRGLIAQYIEAPASEI
jgi:hypothetical protein